MPVNKPLKEVLEWQKFLVAENQLYTFAERDVDLLVKNKFLSYCLDAHDANRLVYPISILGTTDILSELTRVNWEEFIVNTKDDPFLKVCIGPLAVLEMIICIHYNLRQCLNGDKKIIELLNIEEIMENFREEGIELDKVPSSKLEKPLRNFWDAVKRVSTLVDELEMKNDIGLQKLFSLISSGKIQYVENYLNKHNVFISNDIIVAPAKNVSPDDGVRYLDSKRGDDYWQQVYNRLDMSRFISAANLKSKLVNTDLWCFVTSSGQLTLNAWMSSWKSDVTKWPARPAAVASYLSSARKLEGENWDLIKDEFEEARCASRRICRELNKIPEVKDCIDPQKRRKLSKTMSIAVPESIAINIPHFLNSYTAKYCPKWADLGIKNDAFSKEYEINLLKLSEWMSNQGKREDMYDKITQHVITSLEKSPFIDFEKFPYFGPIGDAYFQIKEWLDGRL